MEISLFGTLIYFCVFVLLPLMIVPLLVFIIFVFVDITRKQGRKRKKGGDQKSANKESDHQ